ncbi:hypothetical protein QQ045_000457 [Rhodiola kirilowii]
MGPQNVGAVLLLTLRPWSICSCVVKQQLALAAAALWEIWVYRTCKLLSKPPPDIKAKLTCWGSSLWQLIKADYHPSFERQLILDIFHIPTPMSNIRGRWQHWIPNSTRMTLSCTVNCYHCGGIVRDEKGTFIFGFYIALEIDDFVEGVISALLLLREVGLRVVCIQSSHFLCKHLNNSGYGERTTDFHRWREVRDLLKGVTPSYISCEMNNTAITMSYLGGTSAIIWNLASLPRQVRIALTGDYMRLPTWCRNQPPTKHNKEQPLAPRRGTPNRRQIRRHSQIELCPYI